MTYPELKQLTRAEELFDRGKLDESLEILNDLSQFEGLNGQQKSYFKFLQGLIFFYQNKSEQLIKLGEYIFEEGQKLNESLQSFDGLFFIIIGLGGADKFDEAYRFLEKLGSIMKSISNDSRSLLQRQVRLSVLKGFLNLFSGNTDVVEKCLKITFSSEKDLGNTFELVWANLIMAQIMIQVKVNYDLALKYTNNALLSAEKIRFNHYWLGFCQISYGVINHCIYEYDKSLNYYLQSLKIFKQINNDWYIAIILNNIGLIYCDKGEYDLALEYLEEALMLWERYSLRIEACLDSLIFVALEKGDNELTDKYFHHLENIYYEKKDEKYISLIYLFNKASILKKSARIRDKAKAEELIKQIIKTETLYFDIKIYAYIHLCDLLLAEFRINNNSDVLDEINQNITQLLNIAEKSHSYLAFCETFILKAKLALLNFDIKAARRFLTQAQKIAESRGINRLAMKISHEHDELLNQEKIWENYKQSEASLSERWELAGLNKQMENMVRKRLIDAPEPSDEQPVFLLIVSEGGVPFFSQSFIKDKTFEEHLFGGFFTAINSFIHEMFSEGLDRASFGTYTLLMNSISPFSLCYIYKGQSYSAQNRIKSFIYELKNNQELWDTFKQFYQANRKIQTNDIPALQPLINEIFVEKTLL